ncbi:uncharacterized protein LOC134831605 isoform X2 [Culicoides brevitarsis]|uniref:uncharacterized protein LOC134831605 isoform X2 n=1 Tax=Culicoides brevitarsis TaxID=469753 RepID=UPI00307B13F2
MKKVSQPVVRKIYGGSQVQTQGQTTHIQQQNAVRKINSLLQSGTRTTTINQTSLLHRKCFICDETVQPSIAHSVADTTTASTQTKLTTKIARLVGQGYMVIIGTDDVLCRRCYNLFNLMDKAEADMEKHKTTISNFLKKKYSILDDGLDIETGANNGLNRSTLQSPPVKMQRLNNTTGNSINRVVTQHNNSDVQLRKVNSTGHTNNDSLDSPNKSMQKGTTKLYKCMSCEYKSTDLSTFDAHYQECKGQNNKTTTNSPSTTLAKKIVTTSQIHACSMCKYKTADKATYEEHVRKHYKMRPFKCRICTQRFETREQAQVHAKTHQPDYFKCGMCSATFHMRDLLMKHLETHDKTKQGGVQMVSSVHPVTTSSSGGGGNTTQKLLQETIDEALRDSAAVDISAKNIQFHSCDTCSVTFLNEALYLQHMKQHAKPSASSRTASGASSQRTTSNNGSYSEDASNAKQEQQGVSDDLESIFERMHADKAEINANAAAASNSENMVITQENTSTGGITFNITIPPSAVAGTNAGDGEDTKQQISIDMPTLDGDLGQETAKSEDAKQEEQQQVLQAPVSMPSLDDDQDGNTQESQVSNTDAVPMELDEIQTGADGQQIKFILNENGQILSLDNHILTTDMDGNQILVPGADVEQLQALLQSGGVVMQGEEEGQQILVQGTDIEQLQALIQSGNVVMQGEEGIGEGQQILVQGADMEGLQALIPQGELNAEGTHITTEDGIQIPVSITFGGTEGEHIAVQEGAEGSDEQMLLAQQQQQQQEADQADQEGGQTLMLLQQGAAGEQGQGEETTEGEQQQAETEQQTTEGATEEQTDAAKSEATSGNDGFLNFDELIQPQIINKETTATTTSSN